MGGPYRPCVQSLYDTADPILVDSVLNLQGGGGHPTDSKAGRLQVSGITRQGSSFCCTRWIPRLNNGRGGYVWITTAPILDAERNTIGAIESIRDVTQIKQAEIKLQESEHRLSALMSHLPGMAYRVVQSDEGWVIDFVSEGSRRIFGYKPSDFIDRYARDFRDLIHPDDLDRVLSKVREALDQRKPVHCEYRIVSASR